MFITLQGNTILAMDYMENGNLWDQLPRTNKAGQHIFQWKFRGKKVAYEIALGLHCLHDLKYAFCPPFSFCCVHTSRSSSGSSGARRWPMRLRSACTACTTSSTPPPLLKLDLKA